MVHTSDNSDRIQFFKSKDRFKSQIQIKQNFVLKKILIKILKTIDIDTKVLLYSQCKCLVPTNYIIIIYCT